MNIGLWNPPPPGWLEAEDPSTSRERLTRIWQGWEKTNAPYCDESPWNPEDRAQWKALHRALAAHPNIPARLLIKLAPWYPDVFSRNPVAQDLPIHSPEFVEWLEPVAAGELLRYAHLPATVVTALAERGRYPLLRRDARLHVAYAGEVGPDEDWRAQIRELLRTEAVELHRSGNERDRQRWQMLEDLIALRVAPSWLVRKKRVRRALLLSENYTEATESSDTAKALEEMLQRTITPAPIALCFILASLQTSAIPMRRWSDGGIGVSW